MKLNGHEQDVVSEALKLYVTEINKEIEALEAKGKRPIFTVDYYPQVAEGIKSKLNINK
jgi:hypothetical protein|tara:strand:- start:1186 stop:1362 length:177 start_codon:yes stop_codon:yes gene_type:complete